METGRISDFAPGQGEAAGAYSTAFDDSTWLPVKLPIGVHTALLTAGKIADPFYGENETKCAWIEEREWWYRLEIDGPRTSLDEDERLMLTFHGLDTYATVWLDGVEIGSHQNMFRPAEFDVSRLLRPGETHSVAIKFDPPLQRIDGKFRSVWGRNTERSSMRKAQFGYGWDWGPRLPTVGVWRPIELRRERAVSITGVHFATVDLSPKHDRAVVAVRVEAGHFSGSGQLTAEIALSFAGKVVATELLDLGSDKAIDISTYLMVEKPELWWTHDLGNPSRYQLEVTIREDGEERARSTQLVGIRTIALDQSPDTEERGTRFFRFVLNGIPVFARGANWIPCESFVDAIPAERYEFLIDRARDANMTMLRIWGGGLYEHAPFFETCDRLGLLVWQDFMFACAMYPEDDPEFVAEVDAEARYQIRRLRSHPSLALWCGNNENQWLHEMYYWNEPNPPKYGELYYNRILPEAVAELDGRVPYWPGSPFGGSDDADQRDGNRHNWDVWHGNIPRTFGEPARKDQSPAGVSFMRYADDMGRFISEFGMHASPVLETLNRVIPEDQRYFHSPAMDWHNKDNPKNKGDNLMLNVTGLPHSLEEYIDFSMIAQAEGLKFGIEHFRRRKPHCSGTLVWQLNDCWPVLSWSVLDYYGNGKAGYYYLKRVFSPVLASFKSLGNGTVELWITNDTLHPFSELVTVRFGAFSGSAPRDEQFNVHVPANSSRPVATWSSSQVDAAADRYLLVRSSSDAFPANRHFFVSIKDLDRTMTLPDLSVGAPRDNEIDLRVTAPASGYVYYAHLTTPLEGVRFSDNYFDLEPGESRTVVARNPRGAISAADVTLRAR